jgi:hypothetical protein
MGVIAAMVGRQFPVVETMLRDATEEVLTLAQAATLTASSAPERPSPQSFTPPLENHPTSTSVGRFPNPPRQASAPSNQD